jgi:NAD(P)-dependent dehydrogenase (short-subunit alcohol dehydrogenase family)
MSAAFLPLLGKATSKNYGFSSSIVNISSISGQLKISQHHMPYNASKAAAIKLTEMWAVHCAEAGTKVRVNTVAPGVFPSAMTTDGADEDQKSRIDADGYREEKGVGLLIRFSANEWMDKD